MKQSDGPSVSAARGDQTDPAPLHPLDEHNRRLRDQTRPPDWQNPDPTGRYNLLILGGGTAGLVAASAAATLGAKVALVEQQLLGGDCLNVGCVPSKALLRAARARADLRHAGQFGIQSPGDPGVDFPAVMNRLRRVRADLSPHDSAQRFADMGVDVFLGRAKFVEPDAVEVDRLRIEFSRALIATGTHPAVPPVDGLEDAGYLTNETVFSLDELPPRLAILGAGPVGCEFAQAFARLGSEVTLIEAEPRLLPNDDADAAQRLEACLKTDGVDIITGATLLKVDQPDGQPLLRLDRQGHYREVTADRILVSTGRAPNVDALDLEAAQVTHDRAHGVAVNDQLQTSNPRVYAAGDVCSPFRFTHAADAMARLAVRNALFFGREKFSTLTIPWCTYTDPELAQVGLTAEQAEQRNIPVQTLTVELNEIDRSVIDGQTEGFLRLHLKKGSDRLLGATLLAPHAGELITPLTMLIHQGQGLRSLEKIVVPYPTQAEILKHAFDAYNRTRLTSTVRNSFRRLLAWRR